MQDIKNYRVLFYLVWVIAMYLKLYVLTSYGCTNPRNMMIQTSRRNLSIDFFSDEEVNEILNEINVKIERDRRRSSYHKRYFLLVKLSL